MGCSQTSVNINLRRVTSQKSEGLTPRRKPEITFIYYLGCSQTSVNSYLRRVTSQKSEGLTPRRKPEITFIYLLVIYLPTLSVIRTGCHRVIDGGV